MKKKRKDGDSRRQLLAFREGADSYADFLKAAYRAEKERRKSLIGIFELQPGDPANKLDGRPMYELLGIRGYEQLLWTSDDDDGYAETGRFGEATAGGTTEWLVNAYGRVRTIVILRPCQVAGYSKEETAGIDTAHFYHEIGHVDDFEKSVNFIPGKPIDLQAAESYAHSFACRRLRQLSLKHPLGFYIGYALPQLAASSIRSVSLAAKGFLESDECSEYKKFAGAFESDWCD